MPFFVQCSDQNEIHIPPADSSSSTSSTEIANSTTRTAEFNETMGNETTTTSPFNTTLETTTLLITTTVQVIFGEVAVTKNPKLLQFSDSCVSGGYNCRALCDFLNVSPEQEESVSAGFYVVIIVLIAMLIVIGVVLYKIPKTIMDSRAKKKAASTPVSQIRSVQVSKPISTPYTAMKSVKPSPMSSTPSESITPEPVRSAITPNTTKINEGVVSVRTKLLRLRDHVEKMQKQEESDGRSDKFEKKGAIVMHLKGIDVIPEEVPEEEVVLTKVYYDPKGNEQYDIGSDVDILGSELGSKKEKKVEKLKSGSEKTKKPEPDNKSGK